VKFSIITPSLNQGKFIQETLDSVSAQRDVEWEHLVIDAGSNDETLDILSRNPQVRWTSEPDQGMSDGINKGFLRATGDWVMWLNTDDRLLPGALAKVAQYSLAEPGNSVIYGECVYVDEQGKLLRRRADHRFDFNVLLFYGCYIQSTCTFLRRSVIQAGHLLDVRYKNCMDFDYYLRLSLAGYSFGFLPEALAAFRWHDANTSTRFAQRRYRERLEIQRTTLQKLGRSWLGREWLLSLLKRAYQAKRFALRTTTRHV
jgi:glycosyltransferase involved in cell wall biosynthesis